MDKISYILPVTITLGITCILKLANNIHKFIMSKSEFSKLEEKIDTGLMSTEISYDKFKKISKESLSLNSPVRTEFDFLSFFIKNGDSDPQSLKNNILVMNDGEDYE